MKKTLSALLLFLFLLIVVYKGIAIFKSATILTHTTLHGLEKIELKNDPPSLWIEVHDVSPGYGLEKLGAVTDILDSHEAAFEKVVLFVIPNHGGESPLSSYPEFSSELKRLSRNGYLLGIHGFTHREGMRNPEFKTNLSNGRMLIERSREEFIKSGLEPPDYFAPPGWYASGDVSRYLRGEFNYTYYAFFIDTPNGTLPYSTHEYTWYDKKIGSLEEAKKDFKASKGIFRLTIHMNAVNTERNLLFLDDFLDWVEGEESLK